jgi:hypothetical protein
MRRIAGLAAGYAGADLMHHADALMAEKAAFGELDYAAHVMHVGGAYQRSGGSDDRIVRTGFGNRFIDHADFADSQECESLHFCTSI